MTKLWFASSMRPYTEDDGAFYKTTDITWVLRIEEQWPIIKEEVKKLIAEKEKAFEPSLLLYEQLNPVGKWTNVHFFYWGMKFSDELKKCPLLNTLLKQIPGIVSASFTLLEAHSTVPEHRGDTNASMRGHFGIEIPAPLPQCGIKVANEERSWEEGKWVIFNDALKHSAWNDTDNRRIILLIDVIRPEFMHKKNIICAFILARHVSFFYHRSKLIAKLPVAIKTALFGIALGIIYVFKPIYNLLKG